MKRSGFGNIYSNDNTHLDGLAVNFSSANSERLLERVFFTFRPNATLLYTNPQHIFCVLTILRGLANETLPIIPGDPTLTTLKTNGFDVIHIENPMYIIDDTTMSGPNTFQRDFFLTIPKGEDWQVQLSPITVQDQISPFLNLTAGGFRSLTVTGKSQSAITDDYIEKGKWR